MSEPSPTLAVAAWRLVRREARTLALAGALGAVAGLGVALLRGPRYTAEASARPSGPVATGAMAVASQFGLSIGGGDVDNPASYIEVFRSPELLVGLLSVRPGDVGLDSTVWGPEPLGARLELEAPADAAEQEALVTELRRLVRATADVRAGVVRVRALARAPRDAELLARAALQRADALLLEGRQSQAAHERAFAEQRLAMLNDSLARLEYGLAAFVDGHRSYLLDPLLRAQYDQRMRQIGYLQAMTTSLAQATEQARVLELRDTPRLLVLQSPLGTAMGGRGWLLFALLGAGLGLVAAALTTMAREARRAPALPDGEQRQ